MLFTGGVFLIRFNNDYNRGAYKSILEALAKENETGFSGYGEDEWCKRAEGIIREMISCPNA